MSEPTTAPDADRVRSFAELGVEPELYAALADANITSPFPIQELTLPLALSGADLIGQARTGTGKTLAFGLPLLQRVDPGANATQALVVVPTRELCVQVRDDLEQAGRHKGVRVVAAYGGKAINPQSEAIAAGAPVVVGTPGRLLDLLRRGVLDLSTVTSLVLDEADEMLDLGFLPDVEQLVEATASERQTLLFSATMPSAVVALARRYMHKPTFLRADVEEPRIAPETDQYFLSCHRMDKPAVLARILQSPQRGRCLVFTRTKRMADVLVEELRGRDIAAAPIHSDLRQDARERALRRFRTGQVDVLVATEVAARGLDIEAVTHVVNYDCPDDEKMYLHRIGRTGRAGAAGVAITLAVWNELARLEMIKKALDIDAPTHEVFSTSEILDELFGLPPRAEPGPRRRSVSPGPARAEDPAHPAPRRPSRGRGRRERRAPSSAVTRDTTAPADVAGPADAAAPADVAGPPDAAPPADAAAPADAAPADAVLGPSEEVAAVEPEPLPGPRRRVRRRGDSRQDTERAPAAPPARAPEAPAQAPAPPTTAGPAETRRVRVRRRGERGSVPARESPAPQTPTAGRDREEQPGPQTPTAGRDREDQSAAQTPAAGRDRGETRARALGDTGRRPDRRDRQEPPATRPPERAKRRRARQTRAGIGDADGGRAADPRTRTAQADPRTRAAQAGRAAGGGGARPPQPGRREPRSARGDGKPALQRPLTIAHLP